MQRAVVHYDTHTSVSGLKLLAYEACGAKLLVYEALRYMRHAARAPSTHSFHALMTRTLRLRTNALDEKSLNLLQINRRY
jgi:hypothetical protein